MVRFALLARVANRFAIHQSSVGRTLGWKPQTAARVEVRLAPIDTDKLFAYVGFGPAALDRRTHLGKH